MCSNEVGKSASACLQLIYFISIILQNGWCVVIFCYRHWLHRVNRSTCWSCFFFCSTKSSVRIYQRVHKNHQLVKFKLTFPSWSDSGSIKHGLQIDYLLNAYQPREFGTLQVAYSDYFYGCLKSFLQGTIINQYLTECFCRFVWVCKWVLKKVNA